MNLFRALALLALFSGIASGGETGPRLMAGWFSVTTPEGWTGRRYADGNQVVAEEFDTNRDSRIDLWRFYRRGLLSSEERSLAFDGRITYQTRWDARTGRMVSMARDTRGRGVYDLEIQWLGGNRWEVREDRNGDGIADRILVFSGPPDAFDALGMDLATDEGVIDGIPSERWVEMQSDDGFTGDISERWRYSRGRPTQRGEWDGRRVVWRRHDPEREPAAPPEPAEPEGIPGDQAAGLESPPPEDGGASAALPVQPGESPGQPEEFVSPADGSDMVTPSPEPGRRDRRRFEGMPPGESAARSLPIRMRAPGEGSR